MSAPDESEPSTLRARLETAVWERHANPLSGWSRVLTLPVLMYGIYARRPRIVAAVLGFTVVNPVLFSPPEDADAWMTRVVLNGPITAYAVYAAYRKQAARCALFTALSMATKFAFVGYVARYYDRNKAQFPGDVPAFDRDATDADSE